MLLIFVDLESCCVSVRNSTTKLGFLSYTFNRSRIVGHATATTSQVLSRVSVNGLHWAERSFLRTFDEGTIFRYRCARLRVPKVMIFSGDASPPHAALLRSNDNAQMTETIARHVDVAHPKYAYAVGAVCSKRVHLLRRTDGCGVCFLFAIVFGLQLLTVDCMKTGCTESLKVPNEETISDWVTI